MRGFNKIFGIGLSRTGTTSLDKALTVLGITSIHFPQSFAEIESHRAASDTPVAEKFLQLDAVFPGSLFILTTRPLDQWLTSVDRFWTWFHQFAFSPEVSALHERLYGSARFDRALYAQAYERHLEQVRTHFQDRPDDLLEMDICAGQGWEPLCRFLGVPVPVMAFPNIMHPSFPGARREPGQASTV